jgi:hypothetical protein
MSCQTQARRQCQSTVQLCSLIKGTILLSQSPLTYIYIIADGKKIPPPQQEFALHGTSLVPIDYKQWGLLAQTINISHLYQTQYKASLPESFTTYSANQLCLITDTNSALLQHQKCKSILQQSIINSMSSLPC